MSVCYVSVCRWQVKRGTISSSCPNVLFIIASVWIALMVSLVPLSLSLSTSPSLAWPLPRLWRIFAFVPSFAAIALISFCAFPSFCNTFFSFLFFAQVHYVCGSPPDVENMQADSRRDPCSHYAIRTHIPLAIIDFIPMVCARSLPISLMQFLDLTVAVCNEWTRDVYRMVCTLLHTAHGTPKWCGHTRRLATECWPSPNKNWSEQQSHKKKKTNQQHTKIHYIKWISVKTRNARIRFSDFFFVCCCCCCLCLCFRCSSYVNTECVMVRRTGAIVCIACMRKLCVTYTFGHRQCILCNAIERCGRFVTASCALSRALKGPAPL